jgi:triacylglycerol esterase/lipase EstA (alpha/beta hydrolase family)
MLHETVSTLRAFDLRETSNVPDVAPSDDVVVLVHGLLATAGAFRPLRARLEAQLGVKVASFTHVPGAGIRRIAEQLARLIDELPERTRIQIVGHSLGGLVARWYVQEMGGHDRVVQTIAMATPFGGAPLARKLPLLVGSDLHERSVLLSRLRGSAHVGNVPHLSIAGALDKLAPMHTVTAFPRGEVIVMRGRGHNGLLFCEDTLQVVVRAVASRFPSKT